MDATTDAAGKRPLRARAVDRLYRDYAASLTAWLRRRFGEGPPEPEDVAHTVFAKLAGQTSLDHIDNERAFIFTMATNIAVSGLRAHSRASAYLDGELAQTDAGIENLTPERVYMAKERFQRLSVAFAALPERQKDIVVRCRIYGQTYAVIAEETGWSLGTVAGDMKAAMLALARSDSGQEEEETR